MKFEGEETFASMLRILIVVTCIEASTLASAQSKGTTSFDEDANSDEPDHPSEYTHTHMYVHWNNGGKFATLFPRVKLDRNIFDAPGGRNFFCKRKERNYYGKVTRAVCSSRLPLMRLRATRSNYREETSPIQCNRVLVFGYGRGNTPADATEGNSAATWFSSLLRRQQTAAPISEPRDPV